MRVIYNGVDLMALETHEFSAEPVYDDSGTDYLYTRYVIYVTAVVTGLVETLVNGAQMSYRFNGGVLGGFGTPVIRDPSIAEPSIGPGVPFSEKNPIGLAEGKSTTNPREVVFVPSSSPITHATVRHRLTTPRGPLYIFAGTGFEGQNPTSGFAPPKSPRAQMILESPLPAYDEDCKNGPTPRRFSVISALGDAETFIVEFEVETYVNETEVNNERPYGALLSNRWKQTHTVNSDGYTSMVTEGLALFRTDLVYQLEASPDVSRPIIFMPIPLGFVRVIDYVQGREDVTGIAYRYTDNQVPVNFVAGPYASAAQITAVHRQSVTSDMDPLGRMAATIERAIGILANTSIIKGSTERKSAPPPPGPKP